MMKIEDLIKCNDAEASENLVEEFSELNAQSSNPNPKLYLFIVLNNNSVFLILFNFNLCYYLLIMFLWHIGFLIKINIYICISFLLNILPFLISLPQKVKYNSSIFLLLSKNDISEIFVLLIFKISNFSNLDME